MAYSVIDKVYTVFIDVMTGSSNGYGKPTFYNTDSHTSFIELTVTNGSKEFNMTEFSYMVTVEKPDGTKYTNEYTTQDKSKLVIPVDAQMISCTGNCNAQLYVNKEVDGVNKTLTMVEFNYTVYKGLHEGLISESIDFDNVYVKILNKLDYIINNGADLTDEQAQQLSDAYKHSQSLHAPANIVETMHTEIGEAIDAHHKKVALSASQVGGYEGTEITIKPSNEGLTKELMVIGRTLQNMFPSESTGMDMISNTTLSNGVITCNPTPNNYCYAWEVDPSLYKPNTVYTIIIDILENTLVKSSSASDSQCGIIIGASPHSVFEGGEQLNVLGQKGRLVVALRTKSDFSTITANRGVRAYLNNSFDSGTLKYTMMVIEGDLTTPNDYIPPYFEGIKSVGEPTPEGGTKVVYGSHGKNLFDVSKSSEGLLNVNTGEIYVTNSSNTTDYIKVEKGKNYVVSGEGGEIRGYYGVFYDCSKRYVAQKTFSKNTPFTFEQDGYFRFSYASEQDSLPATNIQIEEGTVATAYEPYQEDVKEVTVPIKGGLKGLSDGVRDSLYQESEVANTMGFTQVVKEYTITGDESWIAYRIENADFNCLGFYLSLNRDMYAKDGTATICNNFRIAPPRMFPGYLTEDTEACIVEGSANESSPSYIKISISKDKLPSPDLAGFKAWLKANPTTVYYEMFESKWSIVEAPQGGNLKTYEGATHVFSKNDFKPNIYFGTDFVSLTTDAKQYCTADGNKNFLLPDVSALEASSAVEIHLFVEVKSVSTLSFPSEILWDDSTKLSNIIQGSVAEFIFTYIKTADGNMWVGTVVTHK